MKLNEIKEPSKAPLIYHAIRSLMSRHTLYFEKMSSRRQGIHRVAVQKICKVIGLVGFNEGDPEVILKGIAKDGATYTLGIPVAEDDDWTVEPYNAQFPHIPGGKDYLIVKKPV